MFRAQYSAVRAASAYPAGAVGGGGAGGSLLNEIPIDALRKITVVAPTIVPRQMLPRITIVPGIEPLQQLRRAQANLAAAVFPTGGNDRQIAADAAAAGVAIPAAVVPPPAPVAQSPEATAVAQGLQQLVQHLSQCPLNGSEKRQLAEGSKAAEKLKEKLTYGQVEEDVIVQCNRLVSAVLQRDYATASAVQVALVNSHWAAHKDWLKGVKFLCQLAQKKMQ